MQRPPMVVVSPTSQQTRVLAMVGEDEILRARLPAPGQAHRLAAPLLLEGLALWLQQRLSVVLFAECDLTSSALGLCDGLGIGHQTLHYEVEVIETDQPRLGHRLGGVASFGDLRRLVARSRP